MLMDRPSIAQFWHAVATADSLADGPQRVTLLGRNLVVFDAGGEPAVLGDLCIHRGAPLSKGRTVGAAIECPFHGWQFGDDGRCTFIPSLGRDRAIPTAARVPSFECQEQYGLVWVALEEPVAPIPSLPREVAELGLQTRFWTRFEWGTSAGRAAENAMDLSHFPFVHAGILGDPDDPTEVVYELNELERGIEFRTGRAVLREDGTFAPGSSRYEHEFPFTIHFLVDEPTAEDRRITVHTSFFTPVSSTETIVWRLIHRNYDPGESERAELELFTKVLEEDREMLECVHPEQIPTDLREELHLRVPDAASLAYRRWLGGVDLGELAAP
jgi:phenylpropionate dioxygenase-like ring-hydroxylating dioxygenase large terminal subunit